MLIICKMKTVASSFYDASTIPCTNSKFTSDRIVN